MTRSVNTHRVLSGASTERLPQYLLTNLNRPDNICNLAPPRALRILSSVTWPDADRQRSRLDRSPPPHPATNRGHARAASPVLGGDGAPATAPGAINKRRRMHRMASAGPRMRARDHDRAEGTRPRRRPRRRPRAINRASAGTHPCMHRRASTGPGGALAMMLTSRQSPKATSE